MRLPINLDKKISIDDVKPADAVKILRQQVFYGAKVDGDHLLCTIFQKDR